MRGCMKRSGAIAATRERVRAITPELTANGLLSLSSAARRLGMTPRTLQRRLHGEGTSYRRVIDEVRLSLAAQAFAAPINIAQAADALGFSEAAPFFRAFKRWTGTTPGRYRLRSPERAASEACKP